MGFVYKIEKLIEAKKVNKSRLAEELGVSRDTVYNWTDENIKASILKKLSDILEVDIMYFFTDKPKVYKVEEPKTEYGTKKKLTYKLVDIDKIQLLPDMKVLEIILK